jgi:hypothetical protein
MDDSMRRSLLLRLAEIVLSVIKPADGEFDHWSMTALSGASWLVCTLHIAQRTETGFRALKPASERTSRVAAVPVADLPLIEDAIEATVRAYDHFFTVPKADDWPTDQDLFPATFDSIFFDLGLQEESGTWTETALPILIWNERLTDDAMQTRGVQDCIGRLAWQAMDGMPRKVIDVLIEDARQGRPGERLADYLTQGWRPEGWLTPNLRRVARTYMPNPLTRAVAREIIRARKSAN